MGHGLSMMSAAVTQPRALQMYQLLDNMELEESQSIEEQVEERDAWGTRGMRGGGEGGEGARGGGGEVRGGRR